MIPLRHCLSVSKAIVFQFISDDILLIILLMLPTVPVKEFNMTFNRTKRISLTYIFLHGLFVIGTKCVCEP